MRVLFYTSREGYYTGGVSFRFSSTPQYELYSCNSDYTDFSTTLPAARDKVWRITKTKRSGIRLQIHCNDIEILNFPLSNTTCNYYHGWWRDYWSRDVGKIYFDADDTASDYYRPYPGDVKNYFEIPIKPQCN